MLHLATRQFIIKCLSLLAVSYAIRRLGPEGLGQAGLALATVSVVGLLAQLGLDVLIPKQIAETRGYERKPVVAGHLYSMRLTFLVLISPVFFLGAAWEWKTVVDADSGFRLISIWVAAFCYVIGVGINPLAWSQGIDAVRELSDRQLLSSVGTALLFLIVFFWWPRPDAFVFIQALGLLLVGWQIFREHRVLPHIRLQFSQLRILGGHAIQTWPLIANSFLAYCFGGLEGLILAGVADHHQIGLFGAANTLSNGVNAFLSLVPLALYPRMLEWVRRSKGLAVRRVNIIGVAILGAATGVYLIAHVVCKFAVPFILGEEFRESGDLLTALIVQYVAYIGYYAITTLLVVLGCPKKTLAVSLCGAIVAVPLYYFTARTFGAYGVAHAKMGVYLWMVVVGLLMLRPVSAKDDAQA